MTLPAQIKIASYSPEWPRRFEGERVLLATVFPSATCQIEHVGSTAVPGFGAKPIIDVLVGAATLAEIEMRIPALEVLGYQYVPEHEAEFPQRRIFAKPTVRPSQVHVHAVKIDSRFWAHQLLFRDVLRADPALAAEYCALKIELAGRFGDDREGYADAKGPFIEQAVQRAAKRAA